MRLTNLTIRKVFEGKSGEGQYGPWQAYNMYFDGNEKWKNVKFGYFGGGNKPDPEEGMTVDLIEFEEKKDGRYTNYTVTKLVPGEPEPEPEPSAAAPRNNPNGGQTRMSMYVSYAKDIAVAKLTASGSAKTSRIFGMGIMEICEMVAQAGKRMCDIAENGARGEEPEEEGPKQEPEKRNVPEGEEDVPF